MYEKYRTVFENSAVGITLVDKQEKLIPWNKFIEGFLWIDTDDLYLKPASPLYPAHEWGKIQIQQIFSLAIFLGSINQTASAVVKINKH